MNRIVYVRITPEGKQEIKFSNIIPQRKRMKDFLKCAAFVKDFTTINSVPNCELEEYEAIGFLGDLGTNVSIYHADFCAGNRDPQETKSKNRVSSTIKYGPCWRWGIRGNTIIIREK